MDGSRPDRDALLAGLVADLRTAGGANLLGIVLYGGLAKGRYAPGFSDINVLIVLRDAGFAALEALAPVLTGARRMSRVSAFIATPDDLRETARLFPVKIRDIQAAHRVLYGDPKLDGLEIDRAALRFRALQELTNIAFRLRQRTVERGADPAVLWGGLVRSLPKLAVTLETLLRERGAAVPRDRPGVLRAAAHALGLADGMERFAGIHRRDPRPDDATTRALVGAYLELLADLARSVERESAA